MSDLHAKEYRTFEEIKHRDGSAEFWYARELSGVLEYVQWRNFAKVLDRARLACKNSGYAVSDHFAEVSKIVKAGATSKAVVDFKLTRYACYLVVQNGDPRKEVIALGQTYFAIQTRRQISGADAANEVHFLVGREVRRTIERVGGTMPEDLPLPKKSISAVEREQIRRLKSSPKKLMLDE
jgi:DNA-damage-inducible protein D